VKLPSCQIEALTVGQGMVSNPAADQPTPEA